MIAAFVDARLPIAYAVFVAALREHKGRVLSSIAGIALGVALGVAIDTINRAALAEFTQAARTLSGDADVEIRGAGNGFREDLYPLIARLPQVAAVSPVVEAEVRTANGLPLRIVAIDPFRIARMQPALRGGNPGRSDRARPGVDDNPGSRALDLLAPDAISLSPAAALALHLSPGDQLDVRAALATVPLHVIGINPTAPGKVGIMDIANAQWRLQRLGMLSRIDIRLRAGGKVEDFIAAVQPLLPAGVYALQPQQLEARGAAASRAYRVNLNLLALVALFTGGFLVFSTQALVVVRRQTQFALLRALGLARRRLIALLLAEGALIGAVGALCGAALGLLLAAAALRYFGDYLGSDPGGGNFQGRASLPRIEPGVIVAFVLLGLLVAVLGSLAPALACASTRPAVLLHARPDRTTVRTTPVLPGLTLMAAGVLAALAPAVGGLPLFGYLAIGLLLFGAIALVPRFSVFTLGLLRAPHAQLPRRRTRGVSYIALELALARLRNTPGETATSLAAILVSFSLVVAMAIMVASFRDSLDAWLMQVLPADLYLRAGGGDSAYFNAAQQARISETPGIASANFLRVQDIALDPARPPVALIARTISADHPEAVLPLQGAPYTPARDAPPPIWISEAVRDVYGYAPGDVVTLPIAGAARRFTVAGIWRDYARQHGAIVLARERYIELTGDRNANQAALWLAPDSNSATVAAALNDALAATVGWEISSPNEIRARSLALFDRSFAITYALEAVAIVVGLFGVANGFGAAIAARRREFGVLRHLGMMRRQILQMLGIEAALLTTLGAVAGLILGFCISLVLIHVVNRQSFRWSMELNLPWPLLAALTTALLIAATATALAAARHAARGDAVNAVREDW